MHWWPHPPLASALPDRPSSASLPASLPPESPSELRVPLSYSPDGYSTLLAVFQLRAGNLQLTRKPSKPGFLLALWQDGSETQLLVLRVRLRSE